MKNKFLLVALFLLLIPYSFSQCKDYVIDSCYYTANSQADSNIFMWNFIPNDTTPIVYIKINFHIWRKDDGTGNLWLDIPEYRDTLQQVVDWLNVFFSNNHLPSDPVPDAQFISDIKVRFVIDTFYYYNNSFIAYCYNETSFQDYLIAEHPERLNNFSYHLGLDVTQGYSGRSNGVRATYPTILTIKQISGNTINTFGLAIHMAHEFGHNFGLDHTYGYSKSLILLHPEFLWDIFGHDVQPWCSSPPDEQSVCWHDAGWDCNPYDSTNTCTNFLMGGTKYTKSISALQAGMIHRALSIAPLRKCTYGYHTISYVISKNTTWDYTRKMYQNIVIDSGVTFTVLCTLEFVSQASIHINPGGKLIIDGGTLTNACNGELWGGIFVEGDPSDSTQSESLQGVVELKNGATIENAICAINVGFERLGPSPEGCALGGGIVKASNASFINNLKAVEFGPYHRHHVVSNVHARRNVSGFSQCNFTVNSNALFDLNEFEQHVNLIEVEGVDFESCYFSSVNNKGTAIQSLISAGFSLDDGIGLIGSVRSSVTGFDVGIRIEDGNVTCIYNTDFNDNNTAIFVEGADNLTIGGNGFYIPYESYYGPTTGVSLTNCPQFNIKNNLFQGDFNCNNGLIINHSGENDNVVKNNTFSDLYIAALAYGKNSDGEDGYKGLQYHCNKFESNNYDIMVSDFVTDYFTEPGSIRFNQGGTNKACGNIFTVNGNSLNSPNYNFQYHYRNNSPDQIPFNFSSNIMTVAENNHQCDQIGIQNPYLVPVPPANWNDELVNTYNVVAASLETSKSIYASYGYDIIPIDWNTYFGTEEIPEELEEQVGLYYEICDLTFQVSDICQTAISYIHIDSLFDTELYHDWLIRTHTPEADYLLAESYYENGNQDECFDILEAIPTTYEDYDEIENQNYLSYYDLREYLRTNEMTWSELEEGTVEMVTLNNIAESGINGAAVKARAIESAFDFLTPCRDDIIPKDIIIDLCVYIAYVNNNSSLIPIDYPLEDQKQDNISTSINETTDKEHSLTIYPNPASTLLTINNGNQMMQKISLCDVLGREIKTYTINASKTDLTITKLPKGFYFLHILTDKGIVNKRFVKE